jgi:hypothetical protein
VGEKLVGDKASEELNTSLSESVNEERIGLSRSVCTEMYLRYSAKKKKNKKLVRSVGVSRHTFRYFSQI